MYRSDTYGELLNYMNNAELLSQMSLLFDSVKLGNIRKNMIE